MIDVSVIYVYYNTPKEILDSIRSISSGIGNLKYEIIIIDNNSEKEFRLSKKEERELKVKIIRNKVNLGYGAGLNQGAKVALGNFFLLTNPDTLFGPFSIEKLVVRLKKDKKIGIIGPQILDTDNTIAKTISGVPFLPGGLFAFSFLNKLFPNNKYSKRYYLPNYDRNIEHFVGTIGGACMLISRKVYERVNGFDERFFLFFEESDICLKIKKIGYKILYFPEAKMMHLGARSMKNKEFIEKKFQASRFKFFQKYHGTLLSLVSESFFRFTKPENFILLIFLLISLFINLYRINPLMLFIGDSARDYLAARDMILTLTIPLVGIPSSVVWLHQGPLSIYLIGTAFLLSNFNPAAPAFLYGIIGVLSTYLVFILGKTFFNRNVGLIASLFYATSPLIVVNARMPYHTSSIPFFASLFFLILYKVSNGNKKLLFLLFLAFGFLLQVELSNGVLIMLLITLFLLIKPKIKVRDLILSVSGLIFGILPFILYDLSHKFVYSVGFPLWIINRIRLFFGLTISGNSTTTNVPDALFRIYQQGAGVIFPASLLIFWLIIFSVVIVVLFNSKFLLNAKKRGLLLVLLWLVVPLVGFIMHASPGPAYFPLLFPAISLIIGYVFYKLIKISKFVLFIFIFGCFINAYIIVRNEYFIPTLSSYHSLPPFSYNLGPSIDISSDVARFIIKNADGKVLNIKPGGFMTRFPTSVDTYKYLVWYYGGEISSTSKITYIIYHAKNEIPKKYKVVYKNKYVYVAIP